MEPEITNEAVNTAVHGLKNELTRLHELFRISQANEVWIRIIVIQEELLNTVRVYSKWMEKEAKSK